MMGRAGGDDTLRARYRALLARRAAGGDALPATLEEIEALAVSGADTPDRIAQLDRVLAHPRTRDEYRMLREIAGAHAARAAPPRFGWPLAAAAAALLAVGGGFVVRAVRGPSSADTVRGDLAALSLVSPAPDAMATGGTRFVWRPVPGASAYVLELLAESGEVLASVETADTVAPLPPGAQLSPGARWWVTARLSAGGTVRSELRAIGVGR